MTICTNCKKNTTVKNPFDEDIFLCRACCFNSTFTATDCKRKYKLNDIELQTIHCWEYNSSFPRTSKVARRYLKSDVKELAIKKYKTDDCQEILKVIENIKKEFEGK